MSWKGIGVAAAVLLAAGGAVPVGAPRAAPAAGPAAAAPEVDREIFERRLERDYPASFRLYRKLEDEQRRRVYEAFVTAGDYEAVTREILRLLYGRR